MSVTTMEILLTKFIIATYFLHRRFKQLLLAQATGIIYELRIYG